MNRIPHKWMGAALGIIGVAYAAPSASLTLQANGPVPTASDVYNFSGAGRDGQNVGNEAAFADGGANDGYTYVAGNRANQGQTFTTGGNGTNTATIARSIAGTGSVVLNGSLRLVENATIAPGITLTNNGTLDILTWNRTLPVGFVNNGVVLDHSLVRIGQCQVDGADFTATMQGYLGHNYQLQYCDNLTSNSWQNVGGVVAGMNLPIRLIHTGGGSLPQRFCRVNINP